ncbi:hypothetical protein [Streptomyces sp. NRRL F-7442]|uniref:hypothetical protein n=2 Tax=Streptomyces TaxID=1883 RepID=UPI0006AFFC51|nr:hypothetical protein [Streptomyces sp. NRRL F-7442]KOX48176.1 hypothetical protein ADL09_12580 [Streptomyces sp. NRRL F-7442]
MDARAGGVLLVDTVRKAGLDTFFTWLAQRGHDCPHSAGMVITEAIHPQVLKVLAWTCNLQTFSHPHSLTQIAVRHVHASPPARHGTATNRSSTGR